VWLCLVGGLSHLCLVFCLFLVGGLCFSLGLVVTCAGCGHNYVAVMLLRAGWGCEGMLGVQLFPLVGGLVDLRCFHWKRGFAVAKQGVCV